MRRIRVFTHKTVLVILFFAHFGLPAQIHTHQKNQEEVRDTWITVFLHGTLGLKLHLSAYYFIQFMQDNLENSVYAKTIDFMRRDPFFYQNQAMRHYGLHKIDLNNEKPDATTIFAHIFDKNSKNNHDNHYYTFGWSGLLSTKARYKDSIRLFQQLQKEIDTFQQKNIQPKIRLVGYSHGGNVCLNLPIVKNKRYPETTLKSVDELILLATPIFQSSYKCVADPFYKKIYNFYSNKDYVQQLDLFADRKHFSHRIFLNKNNETLPDKLKQIQLKVFRDARTRSGAKQDSAHITRNFADKKIMIGKSKYLQEVSPGHTEMWFFGWTPQHYRYKFPLHPIPTAAFMPIFIDNIKKIEHLFDAKPIIADIRPEHNTILFRTIKEKKLIEKTEFMAPAKFTELQKYTWQFKPKQYTIQAYRNHARNAYWNARAAVQPKIKLR